MTERRQLPRNWCWAQIGRLCEADNGRAFKSSEWRDSGTPIIRIANLKDPEARFNHFQGALDPKHRVKHGDLLFAWSGTPGTSFGAHIWPGGDAALNQHIFNIRFDRGLISTRYLLYALNQNVNSYVQQAQGGVGLAHITKTKFMASALPLAPLGEQKRIADALDSYLTRLDDAVAGLERVQRNLKRYRASVLQAAVEGRVVPTEAELGEGQDPQPQHDQALQSPDTLESRVAAGHSDKSRPRVEDMQRQLQARFPELPPGWTWTSVGEVAKVVRGVTYKKHQARAEPGDGFVPLLRATNIQEVLGFESLVYVPEQVVGDEQYLSPGDIIIATSSGSRSVVGKAAAFDHPIKSTFGAFCMVVRPLNRAIGRYLDVFLQSPVYRAVVSELSAGVNINNLRRSHLESMPVPLPPSKDMDQVCADTERHLTLIRAADETVGRQRKRCGTLRQSILQFAFNGRLVDQDPTDEPASTLLSRIEEARSQDTATRSNRLKRSRGAE